MEALINELKEKAGLSQESAEKAVATTLEFIKGKVPPMFADKIEDLMSGKFDLSSLFGGSGGGSPLDMLGNMFGKK